MGNNVYSRIEDWLGESIIKRSSVGGGCISNAERLTTQSGKSFFLKSGSANGMFLCEANGLRELAKSRVIRIPLIHLAENNFILLENIESGPKRSEFFSTFGQQFAKLHRYHNESFGFYEDNYIGATPQKNIPIKEEAHNWAEFYFNKRLLFQFQLAEKNGYATEKLRKGFHLLEGKINSILKDCDEQPSLLHGDLWGGNYLSDENGNPVLIDPAVYYGHREADLAMTKLFGGFSNEFYSAYNDEFPIAEGSSYRENIYILYHVLNHLNLFGRSYYLQAERLLWGYL